MSSSNAAHPTAADEASDHWRMAEHWPELVSAVTEQSIESVSLLLRGLELLVARGRISQAEYKVLAMPAERLKHTGISAQQIVRFQSGRVRQSHEKIDLAYLVESVLQERRAELGMLGIAVRRKFQPVDVLIDPTLGFSLAKAMLDWSVPFGNRMDLRLQLQPDSAQARLWMKTYTEHEPVQSAVFEDSIHWLLLRQVAATDGGIDVVRQTAADGVELTATFRRTIAPAPSAAPALPHQTQGGAAVDAFESAFKTMGGAYVLVCSADASTRLEAVEVVRQLGVVVDGVASAAQALDALRQREVHLLVFDAVHPPADAATLHAALQHEHPLTPVVGISADGQPPADQAVSDHHPWVGREQVRPALGTTVMFTLSKFV